MNSKLETNISLFKIKKPNGMINAMLKKNQNYYYEKIIITDRYICVVFYDKL